MTTTFKPGAHPDADQLSAFIEQALPAHERDGVLAHLAVCGDCREVVALALPEAPAVIAAEASRPAAGRAWFSNWMVFLPAATAVAALALFVVFVHRQAPATQQQARIESAPSAPEQLQSAPSAKGEAGALPEAKAVPAAPRAGVAVAGSPKPLAESRNATGGAAGSMQSARGQLGASNTTVEQNVLTTNQAVPAAPTQNAVNAFAPAANNAAADQVQSADKAAAPRRQPYGAAAGALDANNNSQQAYANGQARQQNNSLQQSGAQTVQVQAEAAPVETTPAELHGVIAGRAVSNLNLLRQPVPSGLAVLSSAAQGPMVLAIDANHAVFVSSDSGGHWKTVKAAWKGHAVMVETAAPAKMLMQPAAAASLEGYSGSSAGALVLKSGGAVLTGTVTDQSRAVIPGVSVTVTDPRTNLARAVKTDASGRYIVAGLQPGKYELDANAQGFMRERLSGVEVAASPENVANFTLRVGAATESVTVETSQPSIGVEDDSEMKQIRKLKAADKKVPQSAAPLFEIVTDKGAHWTSADGVNWEPK